MHWRLILIGSAMVWSLAAEAQVTLVDESDRVSFRSWFVFLADAQYYRPTADVTDCAALVRHAVREALRPHSPEWIRLAALPLAPAIPDVRRPLRAGPGGLPLFRISSHEYAEFADARTLINFNTRFIGRDTRGARPGDLLFFQTASDDASVHLMVVVGPSVFDRSSADWVVYHTGPTGSSAGEVRKVRLADLVRHPSRRWRPVAENPSFVGVFRLAFL